MDLSTLNGMSAHLAVIASFDMTALTAIVLPYTRSPLYRPTDLIGRRAAKYCQGRSVFPFLDAF
jgi:hypothetical protein